MNPKTKLATVTLAVLVVGAGASITRANPPATQNPAAAATRADIGKTLGFVPQFFLKFPEGMLSGMWEEMKTLQMNPNTAPSNGVVNRNPTCPFVLKIENAMPTNSPIHRPEVAPAIATR